MAEKHGLGRGLSSLIPQKKKATPQQASTSGDHVSRVGVPVVAQDTRRSVPSHTKVSSDRSAVPVKPTRNESRLEDRIKTTHSSQKKKDVEVSHPSEKRLSVVGIAVRDIAPNEQQPRKYFDEDRLQELADSIKEHGIMQPLVVVAKGSKYELIAGERRLRAAKKAGLEKVPVIVRGAMDDLKKLELAIIENVQRHDLNVVEEARSYKKLADEFNLTQEEIAQKMGKSRSVIANRMRLATLPIEIQRALIGGHISEGHAKVILSLDNPEKQRALYDLIIAGKLSVRDAEKALAGSSHRGSSVASHTRGNKTSRERMLEDQLGAYFGTRVQVKQKGTGGSIVLSYYSDAELKNVLGKLKL